MPPKKKDAKGGGDDDKPPPPPELPELTSHQLEMNERALHAARLQISLDAFRTRTTSLERTNAALKAAVADTTRATSDVEEYLTWELAARREIVDELQARIDAKTRECEGETRGMEDRVRWARERADGETRELTARVDALRETEPDISRRRDDKTRILDGLAEVSETVARELHEMKANLHDLESALVRDRERLRAESAARVKETRLALMRLTDEELENTTRRVIARNERAAAELETTSRDADELAAKTKALAAEHERTKRELELQRALVRASTRREGDLRACADALAREVGRSDIAIASANEGVGTRTSEVASVAFDFDGAVAETAELERETDALRVGLERHVAATRALARRARAFGAGTGIGTKSRHPATGTVSGAGGGDDGNCDAVGDDRDADARAFEAVYGSLRGFVIAEMRSNGGGRAVSLDDLDARRRAAALDVLRDDLDFGGGIGGGIGGGARDGARDERPRVDEEAVRALAPRGASEVEVTRSKGTLRTS